MPKIVDHEKRRAEIMEAAIRVICDVGIDGATTRVIAREAGYSHGVLNHYFGDKDAILHSTLVMMHKQHHDRVRRVREGLSPIEQLKGSLMEALPLEEESRTETLMEMNFWPRALSTPAMVRLRRQSTTAQLKDIEELVANVRADKSLKVRSKLSNANLAILLLAIIDGISVQAMSIPGHMTRADQVYLLLTQLEALGFPTADAKRGTGKRSPAPAAAS